MKHVELLLYVLLFSIKICISYSQRTDFVSPCPQVFTYDINTNSGQWYGNIQIKPEVTLYGYWIDIILDKEAESFGSWSGDISSYNKIEFKIENKRQILNAFSTTSIRFFVNYNTQNKAPKIKYIRLNGQQICSNDDVATQTSPSQYNRDNINLTNISGYNTRQNDRNQIESASHIEALSLSNGNRNSSNKNTRNPTRPSLSTSSQTYINERNDNNNYNRQNNREITYSYSNGRNTEDINGNDEKKTSYHSDVANKGESFQDKSVQTDTASYEPTSNTNYQNSNRDVASNRRNANSNGRVKPIIQNGFNGQSTSNSFNYPTQEQPHTTSPRTLHFNRNDYNSKDYDYSDSDRNKNRGSSNDYFEGDFYSMSGPKISPTPLPTNNNNNEECGVVSAQPRPLIVGGQMTTEGQWPWHVAIYQAQTVDSKYICGGSLISTLHVLTAAHCVTRRSSTRKIDPQTLTIYLGKYNLRKSSDSVQIMLVRRIFIHPQYNASNFYADIGILKFTKPCEYTLYVRPVCLWKESETDLSYIIDKEGTVVGWGFDENGQVTENLQLVKMPVVKQSTCLWSFKEFYTHFTSEQSYCAGYENGTSVCNGDSGGGMTFPDNYNNNIPVWRLRGLVSIGVAKQYEYKCDPYHYVVFTDIAQFLDWIKQRLHE